MAPAEAAGLLDHPRASSRERTLPDGMPMEYILDFEFYCDGFRREQGERVGKHANPDDYTLDELVAMYDYTVCPLHISSWYAAAPEGVWKRDYHLASVALDKITAKHTGEPVDGVRFMCASDGCDDNGCGCTDDDGEDHEGPVRYVATPADLRRLWDKYPHARWCFESDADAGRVTIESP